MAHRKWQNVDNVANVFLATYNKRDTRTMRICCTLKEKIKEEVLQEALLETVKLRPQFQVKLHRGIFWRYLEESPDLPVVTKEKGRVCPSLYDQDNPDRPLYKVTWFYNRINLDIFHAISDGTGALEFFNILLIKYLQKTHTGEIEDVEINTDATPEELTENSFKSNYTKTKNPGMAAENNKLAYHPHGRKLPYDQLQFYEIHLPAGAVVSRAKSWGVSTSSYLGAAMMKAFFWDMPEHRRKRPVTISMPVNLRNYYESNTVRNFFNNINVMGMYNKEQSLEELSKEFQKQLKACLDTDKIRNQMNMYQSFQNNWAIRAVPLVLKEPGLLFFAKQNDDRVSAVLSNMGVVKLPESAAQYVDYYSAYCSSENVFMVICSFQDKMTLGISYPYVDTKIMRRFVNILTDEGLPVRLYATEVVR